MYVLSNSTSEGTPAQITRLLNNGVYDCFIELLGSGDEARLAVVLDGISNCLSWGKEYKLNDENGENKFLVRLRESGGKVEKLKDLYSEYDGEVADFAQEILEEFFKVIF